MTDIDLGSFGLGRDASRVAARLGAWEAANVPARLWKADPTLWPASSPEEVAARTGWLRLPETMAPEVPRLRSFAEEVRSDGTQQVVLLGMGGSSLAPEVLARTFGPRPGYPRLTLLDSTHPGAVRAVAENLDMSRSLFVVSSKSGTTTEPIDLYRYFWEAVRSAGEAPERRFVAVTDPGSPLDALAAQKGFRAVFRATPTVGGRYSALTMFGLLPAALIGIDVGELLDGARATAAACGPTVRAERSPGLLLGAALGELGSSGRDKLTISASPGLAALPSWLEQLVAESTGKVGRGLVPVVGEPSIDPELYGSDRVFVEIFDDPLPDSDRAERCRRLEANGHPVLRLHVLHSRDLGSEFLRWEIAIAMAGPVLGIDPFDQPDVELAKELARKAMAPAGGTAAAPSTPLEIDALDPGALAPAFGTWIADAHPGDYVAIQAYLAPSDPISGALERLRAALLERLRIATTVGYGPRFLHSTGQLHKGGPNTGIFLQLVDRPTVDLEVPGAGYTFGGLIHAQSTGDYNALRQKGRRVLRVNLGADPADGLARLDRTVRA